MSGIGSDNPLTNTATQKAIRATAASMARHSKRKRTLAEAPPRMSAANAAMKPARSSRKANATVEPATISAGFLMVQQGKTSKKLRLRLEDDGVQSALSAFINDLQERRALSGIKTSKLITNTSGLRMSQQMLRNRWDEAREKAAIKAGVEGDSALAVLIRQFQFKDIRPKAASEIELTHASRLLGHTTEEMTKKAAEEVADEKKD